MRLLLSWAVRAVGRPFRGPAADGRRPVPPTADRTGGHVRRVTGSLARYPSGVPQVSTRGRGGSL